MPLAATCGSENSTSVDSHTEEIFIIKTTTELLAFNVVESVCKDVPEKIRRQKSLFFATLKKVMDELSTNNASVFKGMVKRLGAEKLSKKEAGECLSRVFKEMHTDKHYNWGRVAAVYTFQRSLAEHLVDLNKSDYLDELACATSSFVCENLSSWIYQQGGWESFEKFFTEKSSSETSLWQGFVYTFLGLGALANLRFFRVF